MRKETPCFAWFASSLAGSNSIRMHYCSYKNCACQTSDGARSSMGPNRDREKPHGSPLPHHRADGSRTRRFGRLSRQVEWPRAEAAPGFATRQPEPHLCPLQAHVHPVGCSHSLHWTTITPLFRVPLGTPFGPSVGSLSPRRRLPCYALC